MRIDGVTYVKLKTALKVNGNLNYNLRSKAIRASFKGYFYRHFNYN